MILSTRDQVFRFRGVAGAGKNTTLREVHRGPAEAGHRVLYIAPTAAAAKVFQQEGFAGATTVEDFLQNVSRRESLRGAVVICDEAGLKSNRQGAALLRLAHERGLARAAGGRRAPAGERRGWRLPKGARSAQPAWSL